MIVDPRSRTPRAISRRAILLAAPVILAGCTSRTLQPQAVSALQEMRPAPDPMYVSMYRAMPEERFPVPAVDISNIDPQYLRRQVSYATAEPAGTIVVDTTDRFLYLTMERGDAMRYGIGVGKEGLAFSGTASIARKAEWPRWTPTRNMIEREPERYGPYADGVEGGLDNPLGARALYLYQGGRDTLYRLHGTNEPHSIGHAVSSGCIRLFNQDIIDLHARTPVGTRVVVLDHGGAGFGV